MSESHNHAAIRMNLAYADAIIWANHHSGLHDLPLACALVEQESGGRNIFGCDFGPQGGHPPFCNDKVTENRVHALLAQPLNNGVGLTQLTSRSLVLMAMNKGGAWKAKPQCLVGFTYLHELIKQLGLFKGIGAYNGGPGNPIDSYAESVLALKKKWEPRLR